MSFKRLSYDNYEIWKVRARQVLTREGLWSLINDELLPLKNQTQEWKNKNELALQTIGYLVEDSQLRIIQDAESAKDAWKKLKDYYVKDSSVSKVALVKKLSKLELSEGGNMHEHLTEFENLFEKLQNAGCAMDEDIKGAFMLASLPSSYESTVSAIQGRAEVFTVQFVKVKLLEEFERRREKDSTEGQTAMVTRNVRKTREDVENTRLCHVCRSPNHLMRDCEILKRARSEASTSSSGRSEHRAKSATESRGHVCFATMDCASSNHGWFLDSGASVHMTGNSGNLDWSDDIEEQKVVLADGKSLLTTKSGGKRIQAGNGTGGTIEISLKNVIVVDGLAVNLVSVQAITKKGYDVGFDGRSCSISKDGMVVVTGLKDGHYYRLDC